VEPELGARLRVRRDATGIVIRGPGNEARPDLLDARMLGDAFIDSSDHRISPDGPDGVGSPEIVEGRHERGVRAFGASCSSAGLRQGTYLGVIEPDRSRDSRGDYYHRYNCPQARLLQLMTGAKIVVLRARVKNLFVPTMRPG